MSETEITWTLYQQYLNRGQPAAPADSATTDARSGETVRIEADAVSGATMPYVDMSLGMGKGPGLPVGNVTRKAAARFCQWLSAQTGHFYRLPTEAEWEYAARAGSPDPYFFGSDPDSLEAYAWYEGNSGGRYQVVGKKKPNPWGLYDILGNVAEWTLDGYDPAGYNPDAGAYNPAQTEYPGVLRGGHFRGTAADLRSAARLASDPVWKQRDPQFPRSKWWFTDAPFAGFRIVRPLHPPDPEEYAKYWDIP
jgi:formylglycine-generating enzyme required for sulfatase activity